MRAEGREEQEAIAQENLRLKLEAERRHRDAFVETVQGKIMV